MFFTVCTMSNFFSSQKKSRKGIMLDIDTMSHITLYFKGIQAGFMSDIIPMSDIIAIKKSPRKPFAWTLSLFPLTLRVRLGFKEFESVYKPSSVVYGHLSTLTVADKL